MYFFFTQPPTPRISTAGPTLSLHAARPISRAVLADEGLFVHRRSGRDGAAGQHYRYCPQDRVLLAGRADASRGPRRIGGLGSGPSGPAISGAPPAGAPVAPRCGRLRRLGGRRAGAWADVAFLVARHLGPPPTTS